jgi:predicted house-cleaning noncanonical NTP pyrophosphatase (MazG superfamily)
MELDEYEKNAVRELSESINLAIEKSSRVANAIRYLRELGYEPNLTLKLEIGLQEIIEDADEEPQDIELELTEEDLRTLRRMKISLE